jgi:hypothetical protein
MAQRLRIVSRGASLLAGSAISEAGALGGASALLPTADAACGIMQRLASSSGASGSAWSAAWSAEQRRTFLGWRLPAPSTPPGSLDLDNGTSSIGASSALEGKAEPPVPEGPPEFFPLPESDATVVVTAIEQAVNALERATIFSAKSDTFFSAAWCISGLTSVHDFLGYPW